MGQAPAPDAPGDLHRRRLREPRPARRQASRQRAGTGRAGGVRRPPAYRGQPGRDPRHRQAGQELRLSQERGAFLVNDGMLFVRDSKVTGWSESKKEPAWFKTPNEFRPFLISWGGAEVYLSNSTFTSFGYNASKAYGISISQYSPGMDKQMKRPRPKGWVIDSTIVDSWYGLLLRGRRSGGEGQHLPRQHRLRHRPARPFAPPDHRRQHRPRDQEEARHHRLAGSQRQLHLQQPQLREQAFRDRPRP